MVSIVEADILDEFFVCLAIRPDVIGSKGVIRITHRDADHDDLIFRDIGNFSHDVGAIYALSIHDTSEAPTPGRCDNTAGERAKVEQRRYTGFKTSVIGQHE